ncbi:MAG: transcriptional antiterminator [Erysipelotrichaceae bacterium]|nr:MAG: transcriptional antiterminator [Erysipelotrichaceae bacterium]
MIKKEHIKTIESVGSWEEAIWIASEPLLQDQSITEQYVQKMISNVREMGPYIVISNDIAIPHARPEDGVLKTAVALLKLKDRVVFSPEKSVNTILVLAGSSNGSHINILRDISMILSNKENYQKLIDADDVNVLYTILNGKEV